VLETLFGVVLDFGGFDGSSFTMPNSYTQQRADALIKDEYLCSHSFSLSPLFLLIYAPHHPAQGTRCPTFIYTCAVQTLTYMGFAPLACCTAFCEFHLAELHRVVPHYVSHCLSRYQNPLERSSTYLRPCRTKLVILPPSSNLFVSHIPKSKTRQ